MKEFDGVRERLPGLAAVGAGLLDKMAPVLEASQSLDREVMRVIARLDATDRRVAAAVVAGAIAVLILATVGAISVFGSAAEAAH